jgi:hypothetical protein
MINKGELLSVINKYYLNAMVEATRWNIENNTVTIRFNSPSKEMIGEVKATGFPIEDSNIAVSNTTQLIKLISITNNFLELNYQKTNKFISKLIISDNQFTLNYALADIMLIPKVGEVNDIDEWDITAPLDNEAIGAIVKAKSALNESETVVIKPYLNPEKEFQIEMEFGGNVEYANKVSFYIPNAVKNNEVSNFKEYYNSNIIKEIMYCNKDMSRGNISIKLDGIMKLEFENEKIKSTYYLVSKEI